MLRFDLIIRGGCVLTPEGQRVLDIAVRDGRIEEFSPTISASATEEISASELHVFPGLIDAHVHFNEPGRTEWEGFASGSAALAAGGGTCFIEMPLNASPPTLDGPSFDAKRSAAEASSLTDFALWGGLTPDNLDHLEELAERGVVGFKAFMCDSGIADFPCADDATLRRGMQIASRLGLPVAVHAESQEITSHLAAEIASRRGRSWADFLASRPIRGGNRSHRTGHRQSRGKRDARCISCMSVHPKALRSFAGRASIKNRISPAKHARIIYCSAKRI